MPTGNKIDYAKAITQAGGRFTKRRFTSSRSLEVQGRNGRETTFTYYTPEVPEFVWINALKFVRANRMVGQEGSYVLNAFEVTEGSYDERGNFIPAQTQVDYMRGLAYRTLEESGFRWTKRVENVIAIYVEKDRVMYFATIEQAATYVYTRKMEEDTS